MNSLELPTSILPPSLRYHKRHPSHPLKTSGWVHLRPGLQLPFSGFPQSVPSQQAITRQWWDHLFFHPANLPSPGGISSTHGALLSWDLPLSSPSPLPSEGSLGVTRMLCLPICCDGCDCNCLSSEGTLSSICLPSFPPLWLESRSSQVTPLLPPLWTPNSPPCCLLHSAGPQPRMAIVPRLLHRITSQAV